MLLKSGASPLIKSCNDELPSGMLCVCVCAHVHMCLYLLLLIILLVELCDSEQLTETLQGAFKEAELRKQQKEEERRLEAAAKPPPELLSPDIDAGWEEFDRPRSNSRSLSL